MNTFVNTKTDKLYIQVDADVLMVSTGTNVHNIYVSRLTFTDYYVTRGILKFDAVIYCIYPGVVKDKRHMFLT